MFSPEWWHWVVLGLCLVMAEILITAFFAIWFGIGALIVGGVMLGLPSLSLAAQMLLWALVSSMLTVFWFRYLKPRTITAAGTSTAQAIGEVGLLVSDLSPDTRGQAHFQKPVLGSDRWECYATEKIPAGSRIRIVAVEGSYLKVEKEK